MAKLDREELRKEMIEIFSAYLRDPTDVNMKKRARKLHTVYGNSGKGVDKYMRAAVSLLVNIGWDLPAPPKPSREAVEELVFSLAARKA